MKLSEMPGGAKKKGGLHNGSGGLLSESLIEANDIGD